MPLSGFGPLMVELLTIFLFLDDERERWFSLPLETELVLIGFLFQLDSTLFV
jgi:hypothetical protein